MGGFGHGVEEWWVAHGEIDALFLEEVEVEDGLVFFLFGVFGFFFFASDAAAPFFRDVPNANPSSTSTATTITVRIIVLCGDG